MTHVRVLLDPLLVTFGAFLPTQGRKPFAPQLALMSKLLMGVQKGENCLLESPTGTGKTLALLCAALAWQKHQKEHGTAIESDCESDEGDEPVMNKGNRGSVRPFDDFRYSGLNVPAPPDSNRTGKVNKPPVELAYEDSVGSEGVTKARKEERHTHMDDADNDDDAFESPKKKRHKLKPRVQTTPTTNEKESCSVKSARVADPSQRIPSPIAAETTPAQCTAKGAEYAVEATPCKTVSTPNTKAKAKGKKVRKVKRRVPRVFFCSRTHSQLNQVISELRTCKASFQDTSAVGFEEDGKPFSMTLLASRKSTCINKEGEVGLRYFVVALGLFSLPARRLELYRTLSKTPSGT